MAPIGRRTFLTTAAGVAIGSTPPVLAAATGALAPRSAPYQVHQRLGLPYGVMSGDVTTSSAVLWGRSSSPGRLCLRLTSAGRRVRSVRGAWATPRTGLTARIQLDGLAPGRVYDGTLWFEGPDGRRGETRQLTFATAPAHAAETSFVWSADTCGQGFGRNPDAGGLVGYRAMLEVRPDFFVNAGDHIYADEPIGEAVLLADGTLWRNEVTEAVSRPARSLADYRGRHTYVLADRNVQDLHAAVPMMSQWDDHEVNNNWWPGKVIDAPDELDDRYAEKRVDVHAARGRRAFGEHVPIGPRYLMGRGGPYDRRMYRRLARGPHLDVLMTDMRSHRGPNTLNDERVETPMFGAEQTDWLIRQVLASRATWKVISIDMPLSVRVKSAYTGLLDGVANGLPGGPLGRERELAQILSTFRAAGARNVVWISADVHYTAAHHYSPDRAAYTDFDPFWEFISGPIASGTFSEKPLDPTFGPRAEFVKANDGVTQSPLAGNQFFGQMRIDAAGRLTVNLRNVAGEVLWSRVLDPA